MGNKQFDEGKFARRFVYYDIDFEKNDVIVEDRTEILTRLRTDPSGEITRAMTHLESEARLYRERFMVRLLLRGEQDMFSLNASQRIAYFSHALEWNRIESGDVSIPFTWDWAAFWLELQATGNATLAQPFHQICDNCLKAGRFVNRSNGQQRSFSADQKLLPFALEMQAATQDGTIDWDSFGIPADRFWLDCARRGLTEPDPARAAQWVHDLCDAHQAAANTQGDTGGTDVLAGNEIDEPSHFLWPITVHAFIRLRRQIGLPDPDSVDHPLLRTSFAPLLDTISGPERWQAEPWFSDIVDICTAQIPALQDAKDLVL